MTRLSLALAAALLATSQLASAHHFHVPSGMLLGIYTTPGFGGMRVTGLIPGYSAEGRLLHGDVLLRVAVDHHHVYRLRSLHEIENAKRLIGPHRPAALEIWRPHQGVIYAWVEFTPIHGPAAAAQAFGSAGSPQAQGNYAAQFRIDNHGSARALFQGQPPIQLPGGGFPGAGQGGFPGPPQPQPLPPAHHPNFGLLDPSSLFR